MSDRYRCLVILLLSAFAYFVFYPSDAETVTAPIATFLRLTKDISPWFYLVMATAIVSLAIVKVWGRGERAAR